MKSLGSLVLGVLVLSGCASLQTGSQFASGRQAWLKGNEESALGYFQSVARRNPNYAYGTLFRQGIYSYLGRAQYANGQCRNAADTLERALSTKHDDELARLYYGLSLVCNGNRARGVDEIQEAMRDLHEWLDYVTAAHRFSFGQFWDPGHDIRSSIETQLASMERSEESGVREIVSAAERLGRRMEEEIDRAAEQETNQRSRDDSSGESRP